MYIFANYVGGGARPPFNHQITNTFPLFSLFHQQKISPITITRNLFISPITKRKCPNHQKIANPSLKNERFAPPFLPLQLHTPLYHIYIYTRHLKGYKYSPFDSLLIWLYPPLLSSHIIDEPPFYKSNCLVPYNSPCYLSRTIIRAQ